MVFNSDSPENTIEIAAYIAKKLCGNEVIAFTGNLGAGKTYFTKGIAKGIGYNGNVTSPTFALINEYIGGKYPVYHFDMYRISSWDDLYSTGFFEYLGNGITVVEWSENISAALPENTIYVTIEKTGESSRKITVTGVE